MGGDNNQSEEICNNKLLAAILDIQKNLDKNRDKNTIDKTTTKKIS